MQQILVGTLKTSSHLLQQKKTTDLHLAYSKYLAIQKMIEDVGAMEQAAGICQNLSYHMQMYSQSYG
jgi:hypothetical protein